MIERGIDSYRFEPPSNESQAQARQRLQSLFPRASLRRMTHLGMLIGSVLDGIKMEDDDAVYYSSSNAEVKSLEDYLKSFPQASPLLFQTSVHPSAVQQVMIGRQQPLGRFVPMAGNSELFEQALVGALIDPAPRVIFVAGEEQGTWLAQDAGSGSDSFAASMCLIKGPGSLGSVRFDPDYIGPVDTCPSLRNWVEALMAKNPLTWQSPSGHFTIECR